MATSTLVSGTLSVPYIAMTVPILDCPPPVLQQDFESCRIPGGIELWTSGGFFSPGVCFSGYRAVCTQTSPRWPTATGETAVRCIPTGFDCDQEQPMYATSVYDGTTLSAPAFEIRWRIGDLGSVMSPLDTPMTLDGPTTLVTLGTSAPGDSRGYRPPSSPTSAAAATTEDVDGEEHVGDAGEGQPGALSTASIVGIAIGVSFGLLTLSMIALWLLMRRRQREIEEAGRRGVEEAEEDRRALAAVSREQPVELGDSRSEPKELAADSSTMCRSRLDETRQGGALGEREVDSKKD